MAAVSVNHSHSDGKLEEKERKNRNGREANSQEHLTHGPCRLMASLQSEMKPKYD